MPSRNADPVDPRERYSLYRLCDCPTCGGSGKDPALDWSEARAHPSPKCPDCRGEGRIRQEVASCESPEAAGVALVTLAREGEWDECAFGLLDRIPPCDLCKGSGRSDNRPGSRYAPCPKCKGAGYKQTGTWLISPWLPSARNVTDAARTLARSKKSSQS